MGPVFLLLFHWSAPAQSPELLSFSLEESATGEVYAIIEFSRRTAEGLSPVKVDEFAYSESLNGAWNLLAAEQVEEIEVTALGGGEYERVRARVLVDVRGKDIYFVRIISALLDVGVNQTPGPMGDDLENTAVEMIELSHDTVGSQTTASVILKHQGSTSIEDPVWLIIENISAAGVTVANADGTTGTGEAYFVLTGQIRGDSLDPDEVSEFRPILFNNASLESFDFTVRLERGEGLTPNPEGTLEMDADPLERVLLGLNAEGEAAQTYPLTVRATGTDPMTFDVSLASSPGAGGSASFDPVQTVTSTQVTTSGGVDNIAVLSIRPLLLSKFPGDFRVSLSLSGGGATLTELPLTVQSVAFSAETVTLQNDRWVEGTVQVTPAMAGVTLSFSAERQHRPGAILPGVEEPANLRVSEVALNVQPVGAALVTGTDGTTRVRVNPGLGQGEGTVMVYAGLSNAFDEFFYVATESCTTCCCEADAEAKPYSGEMTMSQTDLSITGRSPGYELTRTYRSQTSQMRPLAGGDVGVDWCYSYIDDRLMQDGMNILVVRSSFRVDVFTPTAVPGVYIAPREFYEQLVINADGDYELRDAQGLVNTYEDFNNLEIPGRLIRTEDRHGNFTTLQYGMPAGLSKYVLTSVTDVMGRSVQYRYYPENEPNPGRQGRLWEVEDFRRDNSAAGRIVMYDYDVEGNLVRVTRPTVTGTPTGNDFPQGRTFRYQYVTSATLPGGLATFEQERLLHNLTHVWYPNEVGNNPTVDPAPALAREEIIYGNDPTDLVNFDRVQSHRTGGTNASGATAGGAFTYSYDQVAPSSPTPNDPFLQVTQTDRNGNVEVNTYSAWDTILEQGEQTKGLRNGEPGAFTTDQQYDDDKKLTFKLLPEGNSIESVYDEANPDRFQQGNLIQTIQLPGPRGGDQTEIISQMVSEPVYQQVARAIDPRGLDLSFVPPLADTGGRTQEERYTTRYFFDYQEGDAATVLGLLTNELHATTTEVQNRLNVNGIQLGLGDLNGDGDTTPRIGGNVIRVEEPSVSLLAGSNQAAINGTLQPIVTLHTYNTYGQTTSTTDPEGNVHVWTYFPENDPDGDGNVTPLPIDGRILDTNDGGYLSEAGRDVQHLAGANNSGTALPANIRTRYQYDDVGNVTRRTNGRGIITDYFVNEHDEVVQETRAQFTGGLPALDPAEPEPLTAFAYLDRTFYDFNGNVVVTQEEDRGDTSNTGGFADSTMIYDILDNVVRTTREVSVSEQLVTQYRYDANENQTLVVQPEGNAMSSSYDERDLLFQTTRGATDPTPDTLTPPTGPYGSRGGQPATGTYNYDLNANLVETVDAEDTDGSAANNSSIAGVGDVTTHQYDGYDRQIRTIDAIGNASSVVYDPNNNVVQTTARGLAGGPSPTDNAGAGNVDLRIAHSSYDELNRVFQQDQELFVSAGVATVRTPDIADGSLTPADDRVTQRYEYDRKSRRTFVVQDDEDTSRMDYDGVSRRIREEDPEGNTIEYAYDDNNNLIETRETDVAQVAGVADEVFLSTQFYDSLDRLSMRVENTLDFIGQATRYRYDSRDNLVAVTDSKGQTSGTESQRRVFSSDLVDLNDPGNVTLFTYDGINRQTLEQQVLTQIDPFFGAEGSGDPGADEFGVKAALSVHFPDLTQGGGDGFISVNRDWDANSLVTSITDDNGNRTSYAYDNLNRKTTETKGTVVAPALADRDDPDTTIAVIYDRDSNVIQTTDENGSIVLCTFDAINRRIVCDINRASGVIGTSQQTHEYDGLSRLRRATDNNEPADTDDDSTVTMAYDSLSRVVEESQTIGSLPAKAISSGWRAENLKVNSTYPNGRIVDATYDGLDRLSTKRDRGASTDLVDYDYIGTGRLLERRYPINGTRLSFLNDAGTTDTGYDALRRPIELRHLRGDNSLIVGFTHSHDLMDNKRREEKLHDTSNSEVYQYDSAYRLVDFQRGTLNNFKSEIQTPSANSLQQQTWTLDGVGNWPQNQTITGGTTNVEARAHSSFNELITQGGTALTQDDNGNQLSNGTAAYEWDHRNRLRRITRLSDNMVVATYSYDSLGRRNRKVITNGGLANDSALNGTTDFYYDGWQVWEERDGTDTLTQQYVYGIYIDEPLVLDRNLDGDPAVATDNGDQRLFYHQNTQSSIFGLTDTSGVIVEGYQYDAYGRQTVFAPGVNSVVDFGGDDVLIEGGRSQLNNPYLYTSRRLDGESSLYYYRMRYQDPVQGRFISRDPIGVWGDPDSLGNAYSYSGNDPVGMIDPMGLLTRYSKGEKEVAFHLESVRNPVGFDWVRMSYKYDHVIETCAEGGSVYADKIEIDMPFDIVSPKSSAYITGIMAVRVISLGGTALAKSALAKIAGVLGLVGTFGSIGLTDTTTIAFKEVSRFNMKCGGGKTRSEVKYQVRIKETWTISAGTRGGSATSSRTWVKPNYVILRGACCCIKKE
jgi:RHS repeat-associated protein